MQNTCLTSECFSNLTNILQGLIVSASPVEYSIFKFSDFAAALTLLVIVFTITDIRYKFRISIAPIPLLKITYYSIVIIGFATLFSDIWFFQEYPLPLFLNNQVLIQGILAFTFLAIVVLWVYYAFIRPPIFSKYNYKNYGMNLYRLIVKGSEHELPVIASELARSAQAIVQSLKRVSIRQQKKEDDINASFSIENCAYDLLSLISNRKFCRYIISSSPHTAIIIFNEMAKLRSLSLPGQFSKNIMEEALRNSDSLLFHEDHWYSSGLIGEIKPFTKAICGNSQLVENLSPPPLDIDYELARTWNSKQLEAYTRCALAFIEDYLNKKQWYRHSYALRNALRNIENSCSDLYKLDEAEDKFFLSDIYNRLKVAVDFIEKFIQLIDELDEAPPCDHNGKGIYDKIANLQFEIIFAAASVKSPRDTCWFIQYTSVWSSFFIEISEPTKTQKIIQRKLRRLLYNEIIKLKTYPNSKSTRILGLCLNVMGLETTTHYQHKNSDYPLKKVVLKWAKDNYLSLRKKSLILADTCIMGTISYDEEKSRLVKTYAKSFSEPEAHKEYLNLNSPN